MKNEASFINRCRTSRKRLFIATFILIAIFLIIFRTSDEVRLPKDTTLSTLCKSTHWRQEVYLNCTNIYNLPWNPPGTVNPQGVSNVYSIVLTCIRWAIDGGLGFVMPRIAIRSKENLAYFKEWDDLKFLFDEDRLKKKLQQECPQLKIVNSDFKVTNIAEAERIALNQFGPGQYNKHVDSLLEKYGYGKKPNSPTSNLGE